MNKKDIQKLLNAGYTLLRKDDTHGPSIKFKNRESSEWTRLGQIHPTKSARDRIMTDLLESHYHLEL